MAFRTPHFSHRLSQQNQRADELDLRLLRLQTRRPDYPQLTITVERRTLTIQRKALTKFGRAERSKSMLPGKRFEGRFDQHRLFAERIEVAKPDGAKRKVALRRTRCAVE